jgi:hypothetical protein
MKKIILFLFLLLISIQQLISQPRGAFDSQVNAACAINANSPLMFNGVFDRSMAINATFLFSSLTSSCTGTLVNRNTDDSHIGYYFITARHCSCKDAFFFNCGQGFTNGISDEKYTFYFNYQSPNGNTFNTPLPNRGYLYNSTNSVNNNTVPNEINNGFEYRHRSQIREVGTYFWGDFAMYEILEPLPPNFNYTYAGWSPSKFWWFGDNLLSPTPLPPARKVSFHHSNSDIKKINSYGQLWWGETPVATGCYTITQIIDAVFGWIWGHRFSTQVICNYVDNPMVSAITPNILGTGDHGSSGASIFNAYNQTFGVCTIMTNICYVGSGINTFGKLRANYYQQDIKNAFNPANDWWIDQVGMPARRITCPENLNLNANDAFYFAASHYQSNNHIVLSAQNNITTTAGKRLLITGAYNFPTPADRNTVSGFPASDYTLTAGNSIDLLPGFEVQAGANFEARIEPCGVSKSQKSASAGQDFILEKVRSITLPISKVQDISDFVKAKATPDKETILSAYPNPFGGAMTVAYSLEQTTTVSIVVTDLLGKQITTLANETTQTQGKHELYWQADHLPKGVYLLTLKTSDTVQTIKVIKQ